MNKKLLVLARRDTNEAMRVAAGLTIFGHDVSLVLLTSEFDQTAYQNEFEDLLDLADIEPMATESASISQFSIISEQALAEEAINAQAVISL